MSAETRAVRDAMIDALKAKSTDYWEFQPDGEETVVVGKGTHWAVHVQARTTRTMACFPEGLLDADFENEHDGPLFVRGKRVRTIVVDVDNDIVVLHDPRAGGFWYFDVKPEKYEEIKTSLLKLMLIAQARLLIQMGV